MDKTKLFLKYVVNKTYEDGGFVFYFTSEGDWIPDRSKARMFSTRNEAPNFAQSLGGPVKVEQVEIRRSDVADDFSD
jgi:hypothetical protein